MSAVIRNSDRALGVIATVAASPLEGMAVADIINAIPNIILLRLF